MKIDLVELEKAAGKFSEASETSKTMVVNLEKTMKLLESSWEDSGQELFYQYFKEWKQYMQGSSEVLATISKNMRTIAQKYSEADATRINQD